MSLICPHSTGSHHKDSSHNETCLDMQSYSEALVLVFTECDILRLVCDDSEASGPGKLKILWTAAAVCKYSM